MKLTKTLCGVTAALTVLGSMAVTVQAEETQLKLLTANFSDVSDGNPQLFNFYGKGYFSDGNKFLKIGEEQIAEWNKTGKISAVPVDADLDVSGLRWWGGNFDGGYVQLVKMDSENKVTERYIVHLNESNGKIETTYKLGADWCYTSSDGYTVFEPTGDVNSGTVSVKVMKPDGTSFTSTLKSWVAHMDGASWDPYVWFRYSASDDEKYCCYVVVDEKPDGGMLDERIYAVYGIGKDGSTTKIVGGINTGACGAIEYANEKRAAISFVNDDLGYYILTLSAETGKTTEFSYYGSVSYVGDNRVVAKHMGKTTYDLIDRNSGDIIASYPQLQAVDDNLFMVVTDDGKEGYIDGNNKLLGTFDSIGSFAKDYALVVNDGKVFLIDKNMNCVSDKVDGTNFRTFLGSLYRVDNGDTQMLMAYTKENATEPTTSETVSQPTTSESDTSSDTTSSTASETTSSTEPSNPATGITMAMIPVAVIGGAAVITAKKRRK